MSISLPWRTQKPVNGHNKKLIETSLTPNEALALSELAASSKSVLEIGSAYGFSAITMALAGAEVTSIDHHQHMNSSAKMMANLAAYKVDNSVCMEIRDSRVVLPEFDDAIFDGAFVDGDHSKDGVKFDALQCLRLVKPGGWIAFHDYNEISCGDVAPTLDALFLHDRILIDTLLIVKVPYPKRLDPVLLTVATLHLPHRKDELDKLKAEIRQQAGNESVEHLIEEGPERYGFKMRRSTERASGQYICWIDDDDWPMPGYISSILEGIRSRPTPDVVTFGSYTPGCVPAWLRFGVKDNSGVAADGGNIKAANHYCAWKIAVAASSPWLPRNYGAEFVWYTALRHQYTGKLVEYHIPKVLHEYRYDAQGTRCQDRRSISESLKDGGARVLVLRHKDGQMLFATGWNHEDGNYKAQWPNGITLTVPSSDVTLIDEIIYK